MKILITGIAGFVGSSLAKELSRNFPNATIYGLDNFWRPGSEGNRAILKSIGVQFFHADVRCSSDFEALPEVDWVIDAAANPSVLAGIDGHSSTRQLVENNLLGTINMLEYCKRVGAGFILLSTSRVYGIEPLSSIPVSVESNRFVLTEGASFPLGCSEKGVSESFSTASPISLYGATKLASETMALEYGESFGLPVWINRCGVLAGASQFGRPDQGIFSYWIHAFRERAALRYIGFEGTGHQVRDGLHPKDLAVMLSQQMNAGTDSGGRSRTQNLSGGILNSMSLKELSEWSAGRFGDMEVASDPNPRQFDIPWMILDSSLAESQWGWTPTICLDEILSEIAEFATDNPNWLTTSQP